MNSKAYDILQAVKTLVDENKSTIKTVQTDYVPLNELTREALDAPGNFPKLIVFSGEQERSVPDQRQTVGSRVSYLLPIIGDLYVVKNTDLESERDIALKEFRDLIDDPVNSKWTDQKFPTQYPLGLVERGTIFTTNAQSPSIIFGIASMSFNVLYWFDRGNS